MTHVTYVQRKKGEFWSLEEVFQTIREHLPDGVESTTVAAPASGANLASLLRNLAWARRLKGELFHVTGDIHYVVLALTGAPVVLTVHDLRFLVEARGWKRFLLWLLWAYLPGNLADHVTAISEQTRQALIRFARVPPGKIRVIPNPVSPEFQPLAQDWRPDRPRLLHVGTTPNKNLERVTDACAGLPVELRILGRVAEGQTRKLEAAGIKFQVFCDLGRNEVVRLYQDCDAVLFPSLYEGFGMPILEGQAVGRPVLTSNRDPMRQVAGEGALLVDPDEVDSIRNGIQRLLREPELRSELVRRGFENVKRYAPEAVAAQYAELYRRDTGDRGQG